MADNAPYSGSPWYESNLFWGPLGLAGGIILTVAAAMKHDLRWLLWFAWPCFGVSVWWLARRTREVMLVSLLGVVLIGAGLIWLGNWLRPEQIATAIAPLSSPAPTPRPQPPEASSPIPAQNPQPKAVATLSDLQRPAPPSRSQPAQPTAAPAPAHAPLIERNQQGGNGDCQANALGGSATVENSCNGKVPPPPRTILMANATRAIDILKRAPAGSKVQFRIVGGSDEINKFSNNIAAIFQMGGWAFVPGSRTGTLISVDEKGRISHGEGIDCGGTANDPSFEAAKAALEVAGYPCRVESFTQNISDPNGSYIYIQIGSRILPDE